MSVVILIGLWMLVCVVMDSGSSFCCPFCSCVFSCQLDLDLHLKAFGNVDHACLLRCIHILLEVDGCDAGVDDHGEWHWSDSRFPHSNTVRACRKLLSGLANGAQAT
jgi:hypothetical protein